MNNFPKEKILSMDDESLKSLIMEINEKAGGNPHNARKLSEDIPSLKNQISKMSEKDAQRLISKIGNQKAEEILKKLGNI